VLVINTINLDWDIYFTRSMIKKYNYIELLRFISAFAVIMAHYMHFFEPFNKLSNLYIFTGYLQFNSDHLPFHSFLKNFYEFGHMGVFFFWQLSGFVLAHAYLNNLRYKIKFREFFINRFARLYPLHFISLILLILIQLLLFKNFGSYQITDNSFYKGENSIRNLIYHILFISGWSTESKITFNFPIWSVSIEIIIYFLFFYLLKPLYKYKLVFTIFVLVLFIYLDKSEYKLFFVDCGRYFFSGTLIYFLSEKLKNKNNILILSVFLMILTLIGNFKYNLFFSSIIFFTLFLENIDNSKYKNSFSILGNLTYSSYLLHVPLQLSFIFLFGLFKLNFEIFTTNVFFILYLCLIFFISFCSYKYIENPLRLRIKKFDFFK